MKSAVSVMQLLDAGLVEPGTTLTGRHRNKQTTARVEPNAEIALPGVGRFRSPSLAANAVTGRNTNGWSFWKLSDGRTLGELRAAF
jgi:hypothetical protein